MSRAVVVGGALLAALSSCVGDEGPEATAVSAALGEGAVVERDERVPLASFGPRPLPDDIQALIVSDEPLPDPIPLPMAVDPDPDLREAYLGYLSTEDVVAIVARVVDVSPVEGRGQNATLRVLRAAHRGAGEVVAVGSSLDVILPRGLSCQGVREIIDGDTILLHLKIADLGRTGAGSLWLHVPPVVPIARAEVSDSARFLIDLPWGIEDFESLMSEMGG